MSISRKILVTAAAVAAAVAAGCGGHEEATDTASAPQVPQSPSTEQIELHAEPAATVPEPITAAESAWRDQVAAYARRLDADLSRGGAITHGTMRRSANVYSACAPMLESAGDPGRYAPVALQVKRACARLAKAARLLGKAIASSEAGGVVYAGTPEEQRFNRALRGAMEVCGNAQYDLHQAEQKAAAIEAELQA